MSVTITNQLSVPYRIVGGRKEVVKNVELDSSYQSEGEPITAKELGFSQSVESAICNIKKVHGTVNIASAYYSPSEAKLHVFDETPGEIASEANAGESVIQITARGI